MSQSEISLCIGIRRIELRRVVELLGRFGIIAQLRECYAQVVVRVGICRVEAQRLGERFDGFREAVHFKKGAADFVINRGLTGLDGERKPELIERLQLESLLVQNCA